MAVTEVDTIGGGYKGYRKAVNYLDAYSNAVSCILAVIYNTDSSTKMALNVVIPKDLIGSADRYFMTGAYFNSSNYYEGQAVVSSSGLDTAHSGLYKNGTLDSTAAIDFYYD